MATEYEIQSAQLTLRARFGGLRLEHVLLGLSEACRKWGDGTLVCSLDILKQTTPGNPIFYWMAATTARYAVAYALTPSSDSSIHLLSDVALTWQQVELLMHVATDLQVNVSSQGIEQLENALEQNLQLALGAIFLTQYVAQRRSPFRICQALLMYRDAPLRIAARGDPRFCRDSFDKALQTALGSDLESFLFVLLQTWVRAQSENPQLSHQTLAPAAMRAFDPIVGDSSSGGLYTMAYGGLFNALSATPEQMERWSFQQLKRLVATTNEEQALFEGPNPLLQFPLVRIHPDKGDHSIAPVPHLIREWLYEPLMERLTGQTEHSISVHAVSCLFEEYVGLLADMCSPDGEHWLHESAICPSDDSKVVDWARAVDNHLILIDAKRGYVAPANRGSSKAAVWNSIKVAIKKGLVQATSFFASVQNGKVPKLADCRSMRPFAIIVLQGDSAYHARSMQFREEIEAEIRYEQEPGFTWLPWCALTIDDFEKLMTEWNEHTVSWLPQVLMRLAIEKDSAAIADIPSVGKGPLFEIQREFLFRKVSNISPELANRFLET